MSALAEGLFERNRDIFVGVCVVILSILWLPIAIQGYPNGYTQPGTIFTASVVILVLGTLFFIVTSILSLQNKCLTRLDLLYFFVMIMLFIGDCLFIIFAVQFSSDSCDLLASFDDFYEKHYRACWIGNFSSYLSIFMMIGYLIILIFAMRYNGFVGIFYNVQSFCKSNVFRVIWLLIATLITIIFAALYLWIYNGQYSIQFTIWLYCIIILNTFTIILAAINFLFKPICNMPSLFIWWILCFVICIYGCYTYYDNAICNADASAIWGQSVMWQFCNIWVLAETSLPFMQSMVRYQPITQL